MLLTPSILIQELWGTAGRICVRRNRGRFIVQRPPQNTPPVITPPSPPVIVDNSDPGFSILAGTWSTLTTPPDMYGPDCRLHPAAPGEFGAAAWMPVLTFQGTQQVHIWYPTIPAPDDNAEYQVYHDGGTTTYFHDQGTAPGQWVLLGTHTITTESPLLLLYSWHNRNTAADAVRYSPVL